MVGLTVATAIIDGYGDNVSVGQQTVDSFYLAAVAKQKMDLAARRAREGRGDAAMRAEHVGWHDGQ